jgi:hypothetical protein
MGPMSKTGSSGYPSLPAAEAWHAWRATRPEADDRDVDADDAFAGGYAAGYEAGGSSRSPAWHTSLAAVLIVAVILAAICYVWTS